MFLGHSGQVAKNRRWDLSIRRSSWHSGLYELHSCALRREASRRELFAKSHLTKYITTGGDGKSPIENFKLCSVWKLLFYNHGAMKFYQSVHQSPCSVLPHSWKPPQGAWPSPPAAVYCRLLAAYIALGFWRDIIPRFLTALVARSWKLIKCTLKTLFRRCTKYQIVHKKQTVNPASSYIDIVFETVTVCPSHI